jgi:hypothetical protein
MNKSIPAALVPLLEAWKTPQVGLDEVSRWSKYIDKDQGVRRQNSLQHSLSITILVPMMKARMRLDQPFLDWLLVMTALSVHDVGEGIIKKDTHYIDKTVEGDLAEYRAFRQRYEPLGDTLFDPLHRAFLLQFARKNPEIFPEDARQIMAGLAKDCFLEALMFDAIERWDYTLYALEQYHERGNEKVLVQVLRNNIAAIDYLIKNLLGFGANIWTREFDLWVKDFLRAHEGMWIEQEGEV